MPGYREYKAKLTSLGNMRRVTAAMKMLSAARFARAQDAQRRARRFLREAATLTATVARAADLSAHPLVEARPAGQPALALLICSDMGLCGGFNNNLVRQLQDWLAARPADAPALVSFVGRRGHVALRRRVAVRAVYPGAVRPDLRYAADIARDLLAGYRAQAYGAVHLAYNVFHNANAQTPTVAPLLPLALPEDREAGPAAGPVLFEPPAAALADRLLEQAVVCRLFAALLENAAGEHGARMTAMENASRNIDQLRERYTLLRNRARQSAITQELNEVVSGAEALK